MHERRGGRGERGNPRVPPPRPSALLSVWKLRAYIIFTMPGAARVRGLLMTWSMLHASRLDIFVCRDTYASVKILHGPNRAEAIMARV